MRVGWRYGVEKCATHADLQDLTSLIGGGIFPEYIAYMKLGKSLGQGTWAQRRARYWRSPWGRKRCLICFRRRGLQIHHLTYAHLGCERWYELLSRKPVAFTWRCCRRVS
jgi:hypothetical protein